MAGLLQRDREREIKASQDMARYYVEFKWENLTQEQKDFLNMWNERFGHEKKDD